jgi:hypothetical protein
VQKLSSHLSTDTAGGFGSEANAEGFSFFALFLDGGAGERLGGRSEGFGRAAEAGAGSPFGDGPAEAISDKSCTVPSHSSKPETGLPSRQRASTRARDRN